MLTMPSSDNTLYCWQCPLHTKLESSERTRAIKNKTRNNHWFMMRLSHVLLCTNKTGSWKQRLVWQQTCLVNRNHAVQFHTLCLLTSYLQCTHIFPWPFGLKNWGKVFWSFKLCLILSCNALWNLGAQLHYQIYPLGRWPMTTICDTAHHYIRKGMTCISFIFYFPGCVEFHLL